jgi:hypothetical protein
LFLDVHVERQSLADGFGMQRLDLRQARRTHAVRHHPQGLSVRVQPFRQPAHLFPVLPQVEGGESPLHRLQELPDAASRVVGLQQDDPDAHLGGSLEHDVVEPEVAVLVMMEIVELAHRGNSRVTHFGERLPADPS